MPDALVKIILLAHAISATVLTGSLTHLAIVLVRARTGRHNPRLLALYPSVALGAYGCTVALGALLYPRYRVGVRAEHLDLHHRTLSVLFDVKENVAVLVGPLLLAAWLSTRAEASRKSPGPIARVSGIAAVGAVWFNALTGLWVTSVRGV